MIKSTNNLLILLLILIIFLSGCIDENNFEQANVSRVIDGDTVVLSNGERVRLLGINTPEKGEYYYQEAKERLEDLIENKTVILEEDKENKENKDRYGRLLRYIYLNNTNVNIKMVREGYAYAYIMSDVKYKNKLIEAEEYAKNSKLGVWKE